MAENCESFIKKKGYFSRLIVAALLAFRWFPHIAPSSPPPSLCEPTVCENALLTYVLLLPQCLWWLVDSSRSPLWPQQCSPPLGSTSTTDSWTSMTWASYASGELRSRWVTAHFCPDCPDVGTVDLMHLDILEDVCFFVWKLSFDIWTFCTMGPDTPHMFFKNICLSSCTACLSSRKVYLVTLQFFFMSLLCLSPDGPHQLRLSDCFQTCGVRHRGVLGPQVQGTYSLYFPQGWLKSCSCRWWVKEKAILTHPTADISSCSN